MIQIGQIRPTNLLFHTPNRPNDLLDEANNLTPAYRLKHPRMGGWWRYLGIYDCHPGNFHRNECCIPPHFHGLEWVSTPPMPSSFCWHFFQPKKAQPCSYNRCDTEKLCDSESGTQLTSFVTSNQFHQKTRRSVQQDRDAKDHPIAAGERL